MSCNPSSTIIDRYQRYHQVMADHTALAVLQTRDLGINSSSPPVEIGGTWYGDTVSPPHPRSLPSDSSDHLQTPATTPFAFDPVPKPYQRFSTDQSMFAPAHAYQQANWQAPQYSDETLNQLPKSLPIPIPSPYSAPIWPRSGLNVYEPSQTPYTSIHIAPTSAPPLTSYQPLPSRPSTSYTPGSLPPTNLRNVSMGHALPASMLVAPSKFDSPYAPRPTGIVCDARPSLSLLSSGSSALASYPAVPVVPVKSSRLSPIYSLPSTEMANLYRPLQAFPGDMSMYPMDHLTDTSDGRSGYLSAASAPAFSRPNSHAGPSSPPLRPISENCYSMPQTAVPNGHIDRPIMRRNSIDIGAGARPGETRTKHLRKRVTTKLGETAIEWESVLERKERRKTQNRLAQRAFRARTKIAESNSAESGWSTGVPLALPSDASGGAVKLEVDLRMEITTP